ACWRKRSRSSPAAWWWSATTGTSSTGSAARSSTTATTSRGSISTACERRAARRDFRERSTPAARRLTLSAPGAARGGAADARRTRSIRPSAPARPVAYDPALRAVARPGRLDQPDLAALGAAVHRGRRGRCPRHARAPGTARRLGGGDAQLGVHHPARAVARAVAVLPAAARDLAPPPAPQA